MSAYNRKVLQKLCSGSKSLDADSAMDESGYASFKVLHNSTVEAPFLFERDSETENCRNASNTTTATVTQGRLQKSRYDSIQFQTPNSSSSNCNESNSTAHRTLWHKSLSLPAASCVQLEESEDEHGGQAGKSPLLLCATKRRKSHYQPMAHHSSPKKSKKKLFPQPALAPICRTRYYDGFEHLDIVGMLSNTLPALECILAHVSSHTLDVMTKVSERWAQAVYKSQRATERLQNHRFKMNLTKENTHTVKRGRMLSKTLNKHLVPLQPSNAIHKPNKHDNYRNVPKDDNCLLVEQLQRIKCPRCGKCSKVFYSRTAEQTPLMSRHGPPRAALSQTLPHVCSFSEPKAALARFYSLDEVKSSPDENDAAAVAGSAATPHSIGECTSVFCKFRFCVHCCCPPHPGAKCLVTELGTPSKVMMPSERLTPPKRNQNCDYKLSRKNSLKRLNF
ncbi:uncharacterized protein Rca1 [Drosophila virilis]|uniref:F-box domain-containing protein n=1 Tax=Drosophila virilis TaxID=7244 RepID=B4LRQ1_DROVI|nr:uncharacterized protein LOC6627647 [Drosophila virilis]EDW64653.1 uncharacterized protein Dvir_GJ21279 [Drosophila virilis]